MTALQHIYLTAHGSFSGGPWVGESAQFGIRLAIVPTIGAPDKGTIFTMPLNGDVTVEQGTQAGAHGTLTKTWTARRGELGSLENCDAGFQIDLAEDTWTFLSAIKAYLGDTFRWTAVKMAPVSAEGKTIGTSSVYTFTTPIQGTASAMLPPQCAMAVSIRANILGRRGRGRIYLPAFAAASCAADGTLVAATATAVRAAFVTWLNALQNLSGTPTNIPMVAITSPGLPTAVRPSEARTGNRIDTIRSRREQVAEVYTPTAL
jgi:hypothetical protein